MSQVIGLPVVDTHVARQAGVVSDVLIDVAAGRVAVLNVQHADGWLVQRIPAAYVYRLGPHTVLVADTLSVDMGPPLSEARLLATAQRLEDRLGNLAAQWGIEPVAAARERVIE